MKMGESENGQREDKQRRYVERGSWRKNRTTGEMERMKQSVVGKVREKRLNCVHEWLRIGSSPHC